MLTRIIIKNVYSIKECIIDFTKNRYSYLEENIVNGLVNPVALYGHNGSGKSSVFKAIKMFIGLMIRPVDDLGPFIVNEFNLSKFNRMSVEDKEKNIELIIGSIEFHFNLDGKEYIYFISTSLFNRIEKELLKINNHLIFSRNIDSEIYNDNKNVFDINRSKLISTLRYFASAEVDDLDIQKVYKFLSSFTFVDLPRQSSYQGYVTSKLFDNVRIFDLIVSKSEEVKEILKDYAEFPLYSVIKENVTENFGDKTRYLIKFDGIEEKALDITWISDGMRNQSILLSILLSLPENGILFVDEVDAALHPSAAVSFLKVVREKKIQLVFSSHNTHLLQHLRPDQIYFAKWNNGYSSYYRLSNIYSNIRQINNIEKMYLANVFDMED